MHLKSLEIQGFKSFTDRTLILFHQGVTAIVGPNGSGKSNVTDAIRWVLGEQSAKALRGGKMEDIIFAGTNMRRPLGFAEVTMLIDNSDGKLPIEYQEVAITRRLYRSGESNYLINQSPCRLKDIHNLFMDTGLGRDGYSIIGQGRVDEILSTKSEDRRKVFEEASGIQKFKTRRDESLRKLEQTENNLTRVNDIMTELAGQLNPLKKQAEQAKQYLEWYDELKELEVALILHQIDTKSIQLKEQRLHLDNATAEALETQTQGLALEEQHRVIRKRLEQLTELLLASRQMKDQRSQERENALQAVNHCRSKKEQNRLDDNRLKANIEQLSRQKKSLELELQERLELAGKTEIELTHAKRLVNEKQEALNTLSERIKEKLAGQENQRDAWSEAQNTLLDLRSQKSQHAVAGEQLVLAKADLNDQLSKLRDEEATLKSELEESSQKLSQVQAEDAKQKNELVKHEEELLASKRQLNELQNNYNVQVQQLDQLGYRLDTLREMQQNMEGYNETVKYVLDVSKKSPKYRESVKGSVGSLLHVEGQYERAIETALGAAIQNVVLTDDGLASELIALLKRERKGRATFLPLNRIKARYMAPDVLKRLEAHRGGDYIGMAHELIEIAPELSQASDMLLARTVISPDLEAARRLARSFSQSLKIVTLDGDVINPGGAMSGGQYRNQSSLLSRRRLLEEVLEEYKKTEKLLPQNEKKIEQETKALKVLTASLEATNQAAMLMKQELAFHSSQNEHLRSRVKDITQRQEQIQDRLNGLLAQESGSESLLNAIQTQEAEALKQLNAIEALIKEKDADNSVLSQERETLRDQLSEAERAYQLIFQTYHAERSIDERIRSEMKRLEEQKLDYEAEIKQLAQDLITLEGDFLQAERLLRQQNEEASTEEQALIKLEEEQKDLDQRSAELFDRLREHNQHLNAIEAEKNRLENRTEQLSLQLDDQRNRLWENYNLTYDNAAKYRNDELQTSVAGPRVQSLKQSIRALGAVNVNAVEDYEMLSERYAFLQKQEEDILSAKAQLDQLIAELTGVMRKQFNENITRINENFQLTFKELFGGGKAEINLEPNKDVLEGDIEIKASPPGKKLQNMLLLSGGERSLAAIALLFAILKLRPTPFCVLDEIEAALDDSNVFRFTDYIKNYADKSQFILVTHRKGTMEAADSIYGVTMQELGVSRILSMELGD